MPQGGVEEGEDFLKAAYRELEEETSIKNVKLIREIDVNRIRRGNKKRKNPWTLLELNKR